jgi:hypothetical protein
VELASDYTNDGTFIFEKLEIPRRSELYHLEPIGVGTPYVESLSGYVARVAQEHFLPIYALLRHLRPLPPSLFDMMLSLSHDIRAVNGSGVIASDLVEALEAMTMRRDLVWTTMLPSVNVLPRAGLIRARRAWCPACYGTWHEKGQAVYDPLLWTLEAVTVCPIHKILLTSSCPNCKAQPLHLTRRLQPGFCARCGCWLGRSSGETSSDQTLESMEDAKWLFWKAESMGELLASGAKVMALPRDQMSRTLRRCLEKYSWGSVSRFASEFKLTGGVLIHWLQGKQRPLLGTVLRLAYKLDLTVVNFLCGNLEPEGASLREMSDLEGPAGRVTTVKLPLSRDEVKQVLTLAASSNQRETLKAVVSRTGWTEGRVRYNFPELCVTIVGRHTELHGKRVDKCETLPILQAALEEYPPPTVTAVAERTGSSILALKRNFPELMRQIADRRRGKLKWVGVDLTNILTHDPPVSLRHAARMVGISTGWMRKKFPVAAKAIVQRFEEHTKARKKARNKQQTAG